MLSSAGPEPPEGWVSLAAEIQKGEDWPFLTAHAAKAAWSVLGACLMRVSRPEVWGQVQGGRRCMREDLSENSGF